MTERPPREYKGYVYRTKVWQADDGGQWTFDVSLQKNCGTHVKRATALVREFEYFNAEVNAAAAAQLWAETYIDCVERGELDPW